MKKRVTRTWRERWFVTAHALDEEAANLSSSQVWTNIDHDHRPGLAIGVCFGFKREIWVDGAKRNGPANRNPVFMRNGYVPGEWMMVVQSELHAGFDRNRLARYSPWYRPF